MVKAVTKESVTQEDLGGADTHTIKSGVAHGAFDTELDALAAMRELFTYMPLSNREAPPTVLTHDPVDRRCTLLDYVIPDSNEKPYDMKDVVHSVIDDERFFEIMPGALAVGRQKIYVQGAEVAFTAKVSPSRQSMN